MAFFGFRLGAVALFLAMTVSATAWPAGEPVARLAADRADTGTTLLVTLDVDPSTGPISGLRLAHSGQQVFLFRPPGGDAGRLAGLIAIPFNADAGPAELTLSWSRQGEVHRRTLAFTIVEGAHRSEKLAVDPRRVTPNKADRERALREQREVRAIYAAPEPARLWEKAFQRPLGSDITSGFGNRRLFNGQLTSYHNGVDLRAAVGTPVAAANRGRVRLARELFYAGNTVIIDHGAGVFTVYAHLDRMDVRAGQAVAQDQVIGLSGASGRVSGPHLHWGLKLNGQNVDPLQFMQTVAKLTGNRASAGGGSSVLARKM